jgi:hypothetical protein
MEVTDIDKHSSLLTEWITVMKGFVLQPYVLLNPASETLLTFYQFQGFNYIREQCDRKIGKNSQTVRKIAKLLQK